MLDGWQQALHSRASLNVSRSPSTCATNGTHCWVELQRNTFSCRNLKSAFCVAQRGLDSRFEDVIDSCFPNFLGGKCARPKRHLLKPCCQLSLKDYASETALHRTPRRRVGILTINTFVLIFKRCASPRSTFFCYVFFGQLVAIVSVHQPRGFPKKHLTKYSERRDSLSCRIAAFRAETQRNWMRVRSRFMECSRCSESISWGSVD